MGRKKRDDGALPFDMFSRGSGSAPPSAADEARRREDGGRIPDEVEYSEVLLDVDRANYQIMTTYYHFAVDYVLDRNPDLANEACLSVSGLTADEVLERTEWAEDTAIVDHRIWNRSMLEMEQERPLREEQRMLTALQYDLFLEYVNQREPELADKALGYFLDESAAELASGISPEARERNRFPGEAQARLDELRREGGDVESLVQERNRDRDLVACARSTYYYETKLYAEMVLDVYERAPNIADAACLEISGLLAHESIERDSWSLECSRPLNRDWATDTVSNRTERELRQLQIDMTYAKQERFIDIVSCEDPKLAHDVCMRHMLIPTFSPTRREHHGCELTYPGSGDKLIDACRVTCGNVEERFRQEPDRAIGLSREFESRGRFAEGMELER